MRRRYILVAVVLVALAFGVGRLSAAVGTLDSPDVPGNTQSFTLEDIYNRLDTGVAGAQSTFTEPAAGPGTGTMHTLNQIMAQAPALDNTNGATETNVLDGKTFWGLTAGQWGPQAGTMPDREGDNASTAQAESGGVNYFTAQDGYYDGDDRVSATDAEVRGLDADITAGNIKKDVNIFGQVGTLTPDGGTAVAADLFRDETAHLTNDWTLDSGTLDLACNDPTFNGTANRVADAYDGGGNGSNRWCMTDSGDATAADIASGKKAWVDGVEWTGTGTIATNPAPVPKTGQTTSYATGDDGDLEKGVSWPTTRFITSTTGIVTDTLTGLIWLKDANCIKTHHGTYNFDNDGTVGDGAVTWQHALDFVAGINAATYSNCGGPHTDWRLPNVRELQSLIHYGFYDPAVPNTAGTGQWSAGNPFNNVQSGRYWSSTTCAGAAYTNYAYRVSMSVGDANAFQKTLVYYVWPVRGGQ